MFTALFTIEKTVNYLSIDKRNYVYSYNGMLLINNNELTTETHSNMDNSQKTY